MPPAGAITCPTERPTPRTPRDRLDRKSRPSRRQSHQRRRSHHRRHVEGSIELGGHSLTIGEEARIKADLLAKTVTISGKVTGNVKGGRKSRVTRHRLRRRRHHRSPLRNGRRRHGDRKSADRLGGRQAHDKRRPFSFARADGRDAPPVHFREVTHNCQVQARGRRARVSRAASSCLNRSKTCGRKSGAMPTPVSATTSSTRDSVTSRDTRTAPPSGVNLTAFDNRFQTTWCSRAWSPMRMAGSSPSPTVSSIDFAAASGLIDSTADSTTGRNGIGSLSQAKLPGDDA